MQTRAIVTGANGMLADALIPLLEKKGYLLYKTDIVSQDDILKVDITDKALLQDFFKTHNADIVFHLAAETDVDKCELNPTHAYNTNTAGTENLAVICKERGMQMVYISTGAVFDGAKETGYTEEDMPKPLTVYGKSKLEGEKIVSSLLDRYYIVRAGWMIGGYLRDKKFVWKIIQLIKTSKEIKVVIDKVGSPTFTKDFAKGVLNIVKSGEFGLYHCVNHGICTRFDIAKKILEYMNTNDVILKPVTSEEFPLPAPRGKFEALINKRLSTMGLDNMRTWQDALKEYIEEIKNET